MGKEGEEECPLCGVLAKEHSVGQLEKCLQRYKEQHGIGAKESKQSIRVNFDGPDGETYQGEVDPDATEES